MALAGDEHDVGGAGAFKAEAIAAARSGMTRAGCALMPRVIARMISCGSSERGLSSVTMISIGELVGDGAHDGPLARHRDRRRSRTRTTAAPRQCSRKRGERLGERVRRVRIIDRRPAVCPAPRASITSMRPGGAVHAASAAAASADGTPSASKTAEHHQHVLGVEAPQELGRERDLAEASDDVERDAAQDRAALSRASRKRSASQASARPPTQTAVNGAPPTSCVRKLAAERVAHVDDGVLEILPANRRALASPYACIEG